MSRITHSNSMHRGDALGPFTQDQINLFRWLFRDGFDMIVGSDGLAFLELAVGGTVYLGASGDNSLNLTVNDETPGGGDDAKLKIIGGNGLVLPLLTADPAAGASEDGQIYYNSTSDVVRLRANGAWTDLTGPGAHIADPTDAHDASAISVLDTAGNFTGTEVETVLDELYDAIAAGGIPATIVDAKGDLIAATAADTVSRLAVGGTDGHVLTVDAAEATGMKWAAGGAAVANLWTMNKSSSQTLTSNTLTQITFDTTVIDGGGSAIDLANDKFEVPATGLYMVICSWLWEATTTGASAYISVKVGSTESLPLIRATAAATNSGLNGSGALSLTAGDDVTMWCHPGGAVTPTARGNASVHLATTFTLVRVA